LEPPSVEQASFDLDDETLYAKYARAFGLTANYFLFDFQLFADFLYVHLVVTAYSSPIHAAKAYRLEGHLISYL